MSLICNFIFCLPRDNSQRSLLALILYIPLLAIDVFNLKYEIFFVFLAFLQIYLDILSAFFHLQIRYLIRFLSFSGFFYRVDIRSFFCRFLALHSFDVWFANFFIFLQFWCMIHQADLTVSNHRILNLKYSWCVFIIVISWTIQHLGCYHWWLLALGHVWLLVAQWFWRRFLNFNDEFLQFCLLSPLEKGRGSSFVQTWISSTQGCFVPSLVEIGWVVVKEKMKMWKIYKQTDRRTDGKTTNDRRAEKLTRAFSTDELKRFFSI